MNTAMMHRSVSGPRNNRMSWLWQSQDMSDVELQLEVDVDDEDAEGAEWLSASERA